MNIRRRRHHWFVFFCPTKVIGFNVSAYLSLNTMFWNINYLLKLLNGLHWNFSNPDSFKNSHWMFLFSSELAVFTFFIYSCLGEILAFVEKLLVLQFSLVNLAFWRESKWYQNRREVLICLNSLMLRSGALLEFLISRVGFEFPSRLWLVYIL